MQEVIPQKRHSPAVEPMLRVGIVLAEDKKSSLTFSVQQEGVVLVAASQSKALLRDTQYTLKSGSGNLILSSVEDGVILSTSAPLRIEPPASSTLAPRQGVVVDHIVAGRTFHWKKEITQTLPGNIEVHLDGSNLVLVNEVQFEQYVACVVASEMSPVCPPEFCKAQAVAARSWAFVFLNDKHSGQPYTICNDDDCQRYQGTTHASAEMLKAVLACRGKFLLTPEKFVCPAYYSKSCGGHVEDPAEIFGFPVPGLTALPDSDPKAPQKVFCSPASVPEPELRKYLGAVDEKGKYYRWTHLLTADVLIENLRTKFGVTDLAEVRGLAPERRSKGKRITLLKVTYRDSSGYDKEFLLQDQYDIRRALHQSFLFSSAIELKINREKSGKVSTIDIVGAGWGHGIGLCQIGALGMALAGFKYGEILKHYFPGCELISAY